MLKGLRKTKQTGLNELFLKKKKKKDKLYLCLLSIFIEEKKYSKYPVK